MDIREFINNYNFHDSLIEQICFDKGTNTLTMDIDFCLWAQEGYKESDPETKLIKVKFKNISNYKGLSGKIDDYSIDNVSIVADKVTIVVCDDFNSKYYDIEFDSDCVEIDDCLTTTPVETERL